MLAMACLNESIRTFQCEISQVDQTFPERSRKGVYYRDGKNSRSKLSTPIPGHTDILLRDGVRQNFDPTLRRLEIRAIKENEVTAGLLDVWHDTRLIVPVPAGWIKGAINWHEIGNFQYPYLLVTKLAGGDFSATIEFQDEPVRYRYTFSREHQYHVVGFEELNSAKRSPTLSKVTGFAVSPSGVHFPSRIELSGETDHEGTLLVARHTTIFQNIKINEPLPKDALEHPLVPGYTVFDMLRQSIDRVDSNGQRVRTKLKMADANSYEAMKALPQAQTEQEPESDRSWLILFGSIGLFITAIVLVVKRRTSRNPR